MTRRNNLSLARLILRSLIFSFCNGNPSQFHAVDGSGYAFWAEQVIALNKLNPQAAARLVRTLDHWKKPARAEKANASRAAECGCHQGIVEGCAGGGCSGVVVRTSVGWIRWQLFRQ